MNPVVTILVLGFAVLLGLFAWGWFIYNDEQQLRAEEREEARLAHIAQHRRDRQRQTVFAEQEASRETHAAKPARRSA